MIYNIGQSHWVLFHLVTSEATLYAIDMYAKWQFVHEGHAGKFLKFLSTILNEPAYLSYKVKIVTPKTDSTLPAQQDGHSCGVFTAVLAYHIMKRAKIHFGQHNIKAWRAFMLHSVLSLAEHLPLPPPE